VLLLALGRVKIGSFNADGKESILAFIEPGELFGELALFDPRRREEFAETVEPSTVVMFPREAFSECMQKHAEISIGVTKLIGLRRQRIERRLKYLLFRSNRNRLVHLLLELAEQYGQGTPQKVLIRLRLSHQDLANIIGSTRETVTVTLGELQVEGLVELGRQKLVLCDLIRLAASAQTEIPTRWEAAPEAARDGNNAHFDSPRRSKSD
jgi:CRP-like cAMP-binding protein